MAEVHPTDVKKRISHLIDTGSLETFSWRPASRDIYVQPPIPTYVLTSNSKFLIAAQLYHNMAAKKRDSGLSLEPIDPETSASFRLVYYPMNIEHAAIFSQSNVLGGGPQDNAPGSVAVFYLHSDSRQKSLELGPLQYCFKMGSAPKLSRSLANKYMGARTRLLQAVFSLDLMEDVDLIVFSKSFLNPPLPRKSQNANKKGSKENLRALEKVLGESPEIQSNFYGSLDTTLRRIPGDSTPFYAHLDGEDLLEVESSGSLGYMVERFIGPEETATGRRRVGIKIGKKGDDFNLLGSQVFEGERPDELTFPYASGRFEVTMRQGILSKPAQQVYEELRTS